MLGGALSVPFSSITFACLLVGVLLLFPAIIKYTAAAPITKRRSATKISGSLEEEDLEGIEKDAGSDTAGGVSGVGLIGGGGVGEVGVSAVTGAGGTDGVGDVVSGVGCAGAAGLGFWAGLSIPFRVQENR